MRVFIDSSAWIAIALPRDSLHTRSVAAYRAIPSGTKLMTSGDVLSESFTRIRYRGGLAAMARFGEMIAQARAQGRLDLHWTDDEIYGRALAVMQKYADLKLSFVDATSAVIAHGAKIKRVFSFDSDFRILGFTLIPE